MPATSPVSSTLLLNRAAPDVGVLVCEREDAVPFAEGAFIRRLCLAANRIGMALVAFDPRTWNPRGNSVSGWSWNDRERRWTAREYGVPRVVYDRAWPKTDAEKRRFRAALERVREANALVFLNGRLPDKGKVGELLARDPGFADLVPPTAPYEGTPSLLAWLRGHGDAAFLKPAAGCQGKRTISCRRLGDGTFALAGRTGVNRPFSRAVRLESDAMRRLHRWIGSRAYIMQPLLSLHTADGEPFDIRVLAQKDERRRWTVTGTAARVGSLGTVTANLHGGGRARTVAETLEPLFGEARTRELERQIHDASLRLAEWLEGTFGRFAEIGLDFGVDRSGKLWFLEANSKPGRAAMRSAGANASRRAVERPLSYAGTILFRHLGG